MLSFALLGSAWVLYLLIGLSVLSLSAVLERLLYFRRIKDDVNALRQRVVDALLGGEDDEADRLLAASPSVEARVIRAGLRFRDGGAEAVAAAVEGELDKKKKFLERGLSLLGTLGNNAPFIGLFGTVLGVIEAFHHLGNVENKAAMGNVMAAIAEALVATGVGIFVALPAVVAHNAFQEKVADIENSVGSFRKLVGAALQVVAARPARASAPADAKSNGHSHLSWPRVKHAVAIHAED